MTPFGLRCGLATFVTKAQLNGTIAIDIWSSDLKYSARTTLEYRDGNGRPIFFIDLRHADFAAQQSNLHGTNHSRKVRYKAGNYLGSDEVQQLYRTQVIAPTQA